MDLKREYDQNFHQWIEHHIALLREGRFNEIDKLVPIHLNSF